MKCYHQIQISPIFFALSLGPNLKGRQYFRLYRKIIKREERKEEREGKREKREGSVVCCYFFVLFSTVGFESLLEASRYSDLCLLYQLFLRFKNGLELICKAFAGYIKVLGVNTCGGWRLLKTFVGANKQYIYCTDK